MVRVLSEAKKEAGVSVTEEAGENAVSSEAGADAVTEEGEAGSSPGEEGGSSADNAAPEENTPGEAAAEGFSSAEEMTEDLGGVGIEEAPEGCASFERTFTGEEKERLSGYSGDFSFSGGKNDVWTGFTKTSAGEDRDLVLPIFIKDGETCLADAYRNVICAEYKDFFDNTEITPCALESGTMDDAAKLLYQDFIYVFDLYASARYYSYEGFEKPVLLLMGAEGEDASPLEKVSFVGRIGDYRVYEFDATVPLGENPGILAHIYAHDILAEGREESGDGTFSDMDEEICHILGTLALSQFGMEGELPGTAEGDFHSLSDRFKEAGMSDFDEFRFFMNLAIKITGETGYDEAKGLMETVINDTGLSDYAGCI